MSSTRNLNSRANYCLEQHNRKEQVLSADEVKGLDTSLEEVLNQIKRQE